MFEPWIIIVIAVVGLFAGLLGGLLGIGGSLVMIPALVVLFGQGTAEPVAAGTFRGLNQHIYQAAAMVVNILVAIPATFSHTRAKAVMPGVIRPMLPASMIAIVGGVAASNLPVFSHGIGGVSGPVLLGREWSPEEVAELLTKRYIGPLAGFRSKQGRPFSAGLKLTEDHRIEFDFGQGGGSDAEEPPDFSTQEPVGTCPKCGARVYEHGVAYVCEKSLGAHRACDFRSGKMILQQPVEREQMRKLLDTGRTDLLAGFVSRRNGRKFKAYLVARPGGGVGFEFEARKPRESTAAASATKAESRTTKGKNGAAQPAETKARSKTRRKAA